MKTPTKRRPSFLPSPPAADLAQATLAAIPAQRGLVYSLVGLMATWVAFMVCATLFDRTPYMNVIGFLFATIYIIVCLGIAWCVFKLGSYAMGNVTGGLLAVISLVPCLGLVPIVVANNLAGHRMRKLGLSVGLLGASEAQAASLLTPHLDPPKSG